MAEARQVGHGTGAAVVLEVSGVQWATEKARAEAVLGRRPGVVSVQANPVAQTATVVFDPDRTSVAELAGWVRDCGFHCRGMSVPEHVCDPLAEPAPATEHAAHAGRAPAGERAAAPQEVMGHGGHAAMSMAAMVADMRNRFLVAAVFSIPILLWSPIGRDVLGFTVAAPFGLRDDVWSLLLSLPVIFYSCWIFFSGALRALRARTLDMMVLVAVAVGAGWLYSLYITLTGGGDVFYEAATVLAAFVLLGHWFEMRARGGANDAIRTLLDLAPPRAAAVERESEHPLAEAVVTRGEDLGVPVARAEEFENVPGHGALARVDGQKVAVGNARLMAREGIDLGTLAGRREEMSSAGRTVVCVAVDGRAAALIGIADAPRPTSGGSRLDAGRGRSRGRHADRGQRGHRPADRRAARRAHGHRRGASRREGQQDSRAAEAGD